MINFNYVDRRACCSGRQVETANLPSGKNVPAREIMDVLFADPMLLNACVEQRADQQFTLKYASMGTINPQTLDNLRVLLEQIGAIRVRPVSYLRPESSGKLSFIKVLRLVLFSPNTLTLFYQPMCVSTGFFCQIEEKRRQ